MKAGFSIAVSVVALALTPLVPAQTYPSKPVRLIVPFSPGDSPDLSARVLAERLTGPLGQQVIVENRAGAGGLVGAEAALKSAADGYTLLYGTTALATITPFVRKVPYELQDMEPVAQVVAGVMVATVNQSFPANTWAEFVAEAKRNPGKYTVASSGNGTILHLSAEQLQQVAGIQLLHVPYKGLAPAMADFLTGQVNLTLELTTAMPHIRSGKAKALLALTDNRIADLRGVPTAKELGVPFTLKPWFGVFVPRGTSRAIIAQLAGSIERAATSNEFRDRLPPGTGPAWLGTDAFTQSIATDRAAYSTLVKRLDIRLD